MQPFTFQRGSVNDFFVGGHLFPDIQLGHGENLVFIRNILPPGIVLYEAAAIVEHIASGGEVAALIDADIPPVCLIVDLVDQMLRHFHTAELQHIHTAQLLVTMDIRIELKAIQILREVD